MYPNSDRVSKYAPNGEFCALNDRLQDVSEQFLLGSEFCLTEKLDRSVELVLIHERDW